MSWILGVFGTPCDPPLRSRLASLHSDHLHLSIRPRHYIAAGGLQETCHFFANQEAGWAVVGLGIQSTNEGCLFLNKDEWHHRLFEASTRPDKLDGHFVAVRWENNSLEAYTDFLGVRTLYLASCRGGTAFSTRLDWLAKLTGHAEIDLTVFGSHWLAYNQLSTGSLIKQTQRIGPGGKARLENDRVTLSEQPWSPGTEDIEASGDDFETALAPFLYPVTDKFAPSLGLSGGLDSRLLLSLRTEGEPIAVHTFGHPQHPDAVLARRIASAFELPHRPFYEPVPDADACLDLLHHQVTRTQAVSIASSVLGLRYYATLHDAGVVLIDGGLGEAARRQFLNRLLRRGQAALLGRDAEAILPHIRYVRADVFSREATAVMRQGTLADIEALWESLPAPQELGVETFLDLLGIRTRLPNFFGYEQNRLDGIIQAYMPFAQPGVLDAVFGIPLAQRRNGRLFRRLIRSHAPRLTRFPLVKGNTTYPFNFSTVPAFFWTKAKAAVGFGFTNPDQALFLDTLRPFIMDTLHSQGVRSYPAYDIEKLEQLITGYYNGNQALATQLDWWLAFEVWRQSLEAG